MSDDRDTLKVLLFSDDRTVREDIRLRLGRKVARDLPEIEVFEVATGPALLRTLDAVGTDYSLIIMDGDAQPEG
ncbi:response regulator, partial [Xanthomonas citri pv. citri]|nr:response regulator [Xanthomonas citri pv. citri]